MAAMTSNGHPLTAESGCCSAPEGPHDRALNFTLSHGRMSDARLRTFSPFQESPPLGAASQEWRPGGHTAALGWGPRAVPSRSLSLGLLPRSHPSLRRLLNLELGFCPLCFTASPLRLYPNSMSERGGEEQGEERARGLSFNSFSFLLNLQAVPMIRGRGEPSSSSVATEGVDCQGTWEPQPAPPRHHHVLSCLYTHTHIQRETNLKMNPGTEIPLDKPDSQVYYYLSRADGSRCSGTELRKQHGLGP